MNCAGQCLFESLLDGPHRFRLTQQFVVGQAREGSYLRRRDTRATGERKFKLPWSLKDVGLSVDIQLEGIDTGIPEHGLSADVAAGNEILRARGVDTKRLRRKL